jgi:hypothetical protein
MKKNLIIGLLTIVTVLSLAYGYYQKDRADENELRANENERLAREMMIKAEEQQKLAEQQRRIAEIFLLSLSCPFFMPLFTFSALKLWNDYYVQPFVACESSIFILPGMARSCQLLWPLLTSLMPARGTDLPR